MRGIDQAFDDLRVVAIDDGDHIDPALVRLLHEGVVRKLGHLVPRAQVGPHQPAGHLHREGPALDPLLEARIGDVGRFQHLAVDGELPAVIDAAQAFRLRARQLKGCAPVQAGFGEKTRPAFAIAPQEEAFAEKFDHLGIAARLGQVRGLGHRHPESPHRVAHGGAWAGPAHRFVVLLAEHVSSFPWGGQRSSTSRGVRAREQHGVKQSFCSCSASVR